MATGYTLITGRPQAVLLHAGVGLLQGSMGVHGAMQSEVPMIVMSGESQTLGEDPDLDIEQQWYGGLSVGGIERYVEHITKWARPVTSPFTLYEQVIRAGEMAQRTPKGPIYLNVALEHMLHEWTPPADDREVPLAPRVAGACRARSKRSPRCLLAAKTPMIVAEQSGRDPAAFAALVELADLLAMPVIWGRGANFANFPTDHPLYLGVGHLRALADADLVPPRRRPRALVSAAAPADQGQDRRHQRKSVQRPHDLSEPARRRLPGRRHRRRAAGADEARARRRSMPTQSRSAREHWTNEHDAFVAGLKAEKAKATTATASIRWC